MWANRHKRSQRLRCSRAVLGCAVAVTCVLIALAGIASAERQVLFGDGSVESFAASEVKAAYAALHLPSVLGVRSVAVLEEASESLSSDELTPNSTTTTTEAPTTTTEAPTTSTTSSTTTSTSTSTSTTSTSTTTVAPVVSTTTTTKAPTSQAHGMPAASLIGIIVGCVVGVFLVAGAVTLCYFCCCRPSQRRRTPASVTDNTSDASSQWTSTADDSALPTRASSRRSSQRRFLDKRHGSPGNPLQQASVGERRGEAPRGRGGVAPQRRRWDSAGGPSAAFTGECSGSSDSSSSSSESSDSDASGGAFESGAGGAALLNGVDRSATSGASFLVRDDEARNEASTLSDITGTFLASESGVPGSLFVSTVQHPLQEGSALRGEVDFPPPSGALADTTPSDDTENADDALQRSWEMSSTAEERDGEEAAARERLLRLPSFSQRSSMTEANVVVLHEADEEGRLRACASIRSHQSRGLSEEESVMLHLLRHKETSDSAFGVFLEDAEDDDSGSDGDDKLADNGTAPP